MFVCTCDGDERKVWQQELVGTSFGKLGEREKLLKA
jgi:hypothetical protein